MKTVLALCVVAAAASVAVVYLKREELLDKWAAFADSYNGDDGETMA